MDTSLLNLKLIQARLSQIRASASRLATLVSLTKDDFVREPDNFALVTAIGWYTAMLTYRRKKSTSCSSTI